VWRAVLVHSQLPPARYVVVTRLQESPLAAQLITRYPVARDNLLYKDIPWAAAYKEGKPCYFYIKQDASLSRHPEEGL